MTRYGFRWHLVIGTGLVAFLLSACSGDDGPPAPTPESPTATSTAVTPTATSTAVAPTATRPVPTASPTPTPVPRTPTAPPTRTPSAGVLYEHGDRSTTKVALTFDMGGRVEPALDIMNWLIAHQVPATIFMTGAMAANPNTDAGRDVLKLIAENPSQFDLGNHSYSHPDFRELTAAAMAEELSRTESAISAIEALSPKPWFRPPYGGVNAEVVASVAAAGYDRTIMWDVDTVDWRPEEEGGPTAADIVAKVAANARGGSIVIMHLGGYNTFEALPGLLATLRDKGLEPVKLDDFPLGP